MITRAQIRAARALVGWTQADLAQASRLSQVAIKNLERGSTDPRLSTINSIETAFDQVGVMFLDAGDTRDGGIGVRLNADSDDVARSFRDHVARCSDMMSPALRASCWQVFFRWWRLCGQSFAADLGRVRRRLSP